MTEPCSLERCAQSVMDVVPRVMHFIRVEMRRHGPPSLSVPQFRTLTYLKRHPGASLSDVANHLGVTRATASAMVDRLVQNGFVDRAAARDERRRSVLTLTTGGADLLESARETARQRMAEALTGLSPGQAATLIDAMALLDSVFREVSSDEHRGL